MAIVTAPLMALAITACEVEQQQPAESPDVQVEEGQLPEYEVEPGTVEVEQDTETVTVPDVDVESPGDESNR